METTMSKIAELFDALKAELPKDTTSVTLFFNVNGCEEMKLTTRTAESLRADGISMRNIQGDWIK